MPGLVLYGLGLGAALAVALLAWAWHLKLKNAGVIDIAWGMNLALMACLYASLGPGLAPRRWLIAGMVAITGLRLSTYLGRRVLGHPEEGRNVQLRAEWGARIELKFLGICPSLFQALLASLLSLPYHFASLNPAPMLGALEWGAAALWAIGFIGESLADAQLKAFKADPANQGKACRRGLWGASRHPNYFFEWLMWLSYFVYACASPWGWTTIYAPALMLHFLLNVTGVKATEEQCLRSRGDDYRRYQEQTSAFVPWFKKS